MRVTVAAVVLALSSAGAVAAQARDGRAPPDDPQWAERVEEARKFAAQRHGHVGFAVADEDGELHGHNAGAHFESASVVKVMLMVAYLRERRNHGLDDHDRNLLGPMIKRSDNGAANTVYAEVGLGRAARAGARRRHEGLQRQ